MRRAGIGRAPKLDPADTQAKGLGYVEVNAPKSLDPKSQDQPAKVRAHCGTCLQFRGNAADAWGPSQCLSQPRR